MFNAAGLILVTISFGLVILNIRLALVGSTSIILLPTVLGSVGAKLLAPSWQAFSLIISAVFCAELAVLAWATRVLRFRRRAGWDVPPSPLRVKTPDSFDSGLGCILEGLKGLGEQRRSRYLRGFWKWHPASGITLIVQQIDSLADDPEKAREALEVCGVTSQASLQESGDFLRAIRRGISE